MYSTVERDTHFQHVLNHLQTNTGVQGVVQLGSGVAGYQDRYSDIDLMVAARTDVDPQSIKRRLADYFLQLSPVFIKEKQFGPDIYLLIVLLENRLEFNVSIAPLEILPVRSTLWNVVVDRDGQLLQHMKTEHERFIASSIRYETSDVPFEFIYASLALEKELKRNNPIYALKMLETLRELTLTAQALKEGRKVHQFKAYHTLNHSFIEDYLQTYPASVDPVSIRRAKQSLHALFATCLEDHPQFKLESYMQRLLHEA
ncbi:aminoglycoside 6-adenylyltransferase [Exiguobacterium sp. SL-9]|uniref:aminoglycoside 6-adenylyltransferase n=1 Tax=Exiguobacterium sp. SL-9 TaxID=2510963 RepID=UPI00103A8CEB|nr:aminoglycoside 6-adenylyltransferase [Exiguobacterium sp. SL-9]TCI21175.1 hypothetical protein EVJ34_12165 [Exiguobacterium sp. SL-9]